MEDKLLYYKNEIQNYFKDLINIILQKKRRDSNNKSTGDSSLDSNKSLNYEFTRSELHILLIV